MQHGTNDAHQIHICARTARQSQDSLQRVHLYLRQNTTRTKVLGVLKAAIPELYGTADHGQRRDVLCGTEPCAQSQPGAVSE